MRLLRWFAREDAAADYECVTIAQKITNGISCIVIVVFSVAPNTTTSHYKTFGVSSLAQYLRQLGDISRNGRTRVRYRNPLNAQTDAEPNASTKIGGRTAETTPNLICVRRKSSKGIRYGLDGSNSGFELASFSSN